MNRMDINEDKRILLAVWAFVAKPLVSQFLFSFCSVFLFSAMTNERLEILSEFDDGGWLAFLALLPIPFFIAKWAVPFDFQGVECRKAIFVTAMVFMVTGLITIEGDTYHPFFRMVLTLTPLVLFWIWVLLFRNSKLKKGQE